MRICSSSWNESVQSAKFPSPDPPRSTVSKKPVGICRQVPDLLALIWLGPGLGIYGGCTGAKIDDEQIDSYRHGPLGFLPVSATIWTPKASLLKEMDFPGRLLHERPSSEKRA